MNNKRICKRYAKELQAKARGKSTNQHITPALAEYLKTNGRNVLYHMNNSFVYTGAEVTIGNNDANLYINTWNNTVKLRWDGKEKSYRLNQETLDQIDYYYFGQYEKEMAEDFA